MRLAWVPPGQRDARTVSRSFLPDNRVQNPDRREDRPHRPAEERRRERLRIVGGTVIVLVVLHAEVEERNPGGVERTLVGFVGPVPLARDVPAVVAEEQADRRARREGIERRAGARQGGRGRRVEAAPSASSPHI